MNSNYIVNINYNSIDLCDSKDLSPNFKLSKKTYQEDFTCNCNSRIVLSTIKGTEDQIFKLTFVRIEDCPNWMKDKLHEIRKNEIEMINKEKTEIQTIEEIKPKKKFLSIFKWSKK